MIEAINSCNSNHVIRNIIHPKCSYGTPNAKHLSYISNDAKKMVAAGACTGAVSMITDVLLNTNELVKSNFSVIKSILRDAAIWTGIGAACYGVFSLLEFTLVKKTQHS